MLFSLSFLLPLVAAQAASSSTASSTDGGSATSSVSAAPSTTAQARPVEWMRLDPLLPLPYNETQALGSNSISQPSQQSSWTKGETHSVIFKDAVPVAQRNVTSLALSYNNGTGRSFAASYYMDRLSTSEKEEKFGDATGKTGSGFQMWAINRTCWLDDTERPIQECVYAVSEEFQIEPEPMKGGGAATKMEGLTALVIASMALGLAAVA